MNVSVVRSLRRVVALSSPVLILFYLQVALAAAGPAPPSEGPHIYLQDTQLLRINHSGDPAAVQALVTGEAQPLCFASADVDEDGVADLLVGYGTPIGGAIVLHRGNLDAFAPPSRASLLALSA